MAVAMGFIAAAELADCLDLQRRLAQLGRSIPIGKIMLAKGYLTAFQIEQILNAQSRRAVRCASCGAEFAIGEGLEELRGPWRCPSCMKRLSERPPAEPGAAAPDLRTQELASAGPPPGPALPLRIEPKGGEPLDLEVPPGGRLELGRSPGGEGIALPDSALSRRHCAIVDEGGALFVEDLGSRNGTFVNGERIVRRALRPGDEIVIGESRIFVRAARPGAAARSNTTDFFSAEGLCSLCGEVVSADSLSAGRAQKTAQGVFCEKCLRVALVPGRVLGGYRILEQIGFGGMAEVYRAEQVRGGLIVALKTLIDPQNASETARRRFVQEARAGARLEHPNLVRIYDAGEDSGIPYIVMEYVQGEDLATVLDRRGFLPVLESLGIALDIASALEYAHEHGVIHRDVKPANILLDKVYRRSRLLDLGVAKLQDLDERARLTRVGVGLGTLEYASPEQIESARDVDGRADIYSLGATLYRMVVGLRPFTASGELDLAKAILYDPLSWPADSAERVPEPVRKVIERAMEKRPSARFATAGELREALARAREQLD